MSKKGNPYNLTDIFPSLKEINEQSELIVRYEKHLGTDPSSIDEQEGFIKGVVWAISYMNNKLKCHGKKKL
jgi:hypothetical protein